VRPDPTEGSQAALNQPGQADHRVHGVCDAGYDELTQGTGAEKRAGAERVAQPRIRAFTPGSRAGQRLRALDDDRSEPSRGGQRVGGRTRVIWGDSVIVKKRASVRAARGLGRRVVWGDRGVGGDSSRVDQQRVAGATEWLG